ncbi:carbohydrate kinase family protein [Streptomyces sp. ASQP_92]|uniref:carbohydrate kinase family protein n=1 Tax=Streptomyces sp. ASQP_92 TaxID=2979116 RepID=UPI0021BE231E|nr:carbohydrate kinase family protein [Streptomyces sp. ASQP_92]MCT9094064.1 carbohydrate kinase family protein [Streptomyces sp. ASQP_92]
MLIAGAYAVDLVLTDLRGAVRAGAEVWADGLDMVPGGAFTLAMGLHRLGRQTVWAADFGTDVFSREVLAAARQEGMDEAGFRHHPRPVRNVTVALSDRKDRAMIAHEDPITARPLAELIDRFRPSVVMLPFLQFGPETTDALEMAAQHETRVFMDCQDYAGHIGMDDVRKALGQVDVFAPNESEALRVTGAGTVEKALELLCELVPTVVIKRGPAGAVAATKGLRASQDSLTVPVVDTTGAGDCFNVGFVHQWMEGSPLNDCLAAAVACGAASVTGPGSSNALTAPELTAWLTRLPH